MAVDSVCVLEVLDPKISDSDSIKSNLYLQLLRMKSAYVSTALAHCCCQGNGSGSGSGNAL